MQQATVNLLSDMGAQPATLQAGLSRAGRSTRPRPTATITDPAGGATVPGGNVTISGTAADTGGVVAAVEVSTDGGTTWSRATGTTSWTYTFNASDGPVTAQARAVDDAANIGSADERDLHVAADVCPCSIFTPSTTGVQENDTNAVELGVKFRSDVAGFDHRDPLLQDGRQHRDPHRHAVGHDRGEPRQRHVRRRVRDRLAGGHLRRARSRSPPTPPMSPRTTRTPATTPSARRSRRPASTTRRSMPSRAGSTDPTASTHTAAAASTRPTTFGSSNYLVDVVFVDQAVSDTTPPTITGRAPVPGRLRRRRRGQRHGDVQRADGGRIDHDLELRAARPVQRHRCRDGELQRGYADGGPRPEQRPRLQHDLHRDREGGRRRGHRCSQSREPAGGRCDLVVHDRGPAAATARRGPRRPDPRRVRGGRTRSAATTPRSSGTRA